LGLLKHLLFWPVTGPNFLTRFALEKVGDTVREELTNDEAVKEDLLALHIRLELGEIDDEQYALEEAALMQRLREVRQWREEFGMGMAGGPVRVAGSAAGAAAEPNLAEEVIATPPGSVPDSVAADAEQAASGGIASPEGASVEINFDWE
jgi:hypothetical protein